MIMEWFKELFSKFVAWLFSDVSVRRDSVKTHQGEERILPQENFKDEGVSHKAVAQALRAWKEAENYFDQVKDPDLVDYAAYEIQTAKRRYLCLLKRAGSNDKAM